jgi:hypothetical protein
MASSFGKGGCEHSASHVVDGFAGKAQKARNVIECRHASGFSF